MADEGVAEVVVEVVAAVARTGEEVAMDGEVLHPLRAKAVHSSY